MAGEEDVPVSVRVDLEGGGDLGARVQRSQAGELSSPLWVQTPCSGGQWFVRGSTWLWTATRRPRLCRGLDVGVKVSGTTVMDTIGGEACMLSRVGWFRVSQVGFLREALSEQWAKYVSCCICLFWSRWVHGRRGGLRPDPACGVLAPASRRRATALGATLLQTSVP